MKISKEKQKVKIHLIANNDYSRLSIRNNSFKFLVFNNVTI